MYVGNLISGCSAFSNSSLKIWKFLVHVLLKPRLESYAHYFASMWNECNCAIVWTLFGVAFFGIGMKTDLFQCYGHSWVFQICWHTECSILAAASFRIWNSSAGKKWSTGEGNSNHFSILALRIPWKYEKAKRFDIKKWTSQVSRCPTCYWRRAKK